MSRSRRFLFLLLRRVFLQGIFQLQSPERDDDGGITSAAGVSRSVGDFRAKEKEGITVVSRIELMHGMVK